MNGKKSLLSLKINELHSSLLRWYRRNGRKFAWRESRDPYVILVSEIMLQQTQTARVAEKLPIFLKRFPSVKALARAPRAGVIQAWQGMGYNRRAVHLHDCAKRILENKGIFPQETEELVHLPGIGRYTASAIACFAHGERTPVVDVNIRRVLSRLIKKQSSLYTVLDENATWDIAESLLPRKNYYEWNQALMDVGATLCLKRSACCNECPLRLHCASAKALIGMNGSRSGPSKKAEPSHKSIPNRIWRGKVVETLRAKKTATVSHIGKAIDAQFTPEEMPWLQKLIGGLVRDRLVQIKGRKIALAE